MKVYEIRDNRDHFWEWNVILTKSVDQKLSIIKSLNSDEKISLSIGGRISVILINIQDDKKLRKEKPFQSDILYWTDDISLSAYKAYNGVIISGKFKKRLVKYTLPEHKIYPLEIVNAETKEVNLDYYLLQVYGSISDLTIFNESEYTYRHRRSEEIIKKTIGEFKTLKEFSNTKKRFRREKNIMIDIATRVIDTPYDIIPSYSNNIYVSEKFLREEPKLKGVVFREQKDIVIKTE